MKLTLLLNNNENVCASDASDEQLAGLTPVNCSLLGAAAYLTGITPSNCSRIGINDGQAPNQMEYYHLNA
ncbi:hypothetical protein [Paenibacillus sp. LPE1-1-1.1]|uniref:hypothetical protein n=1 Tax=Paenibacillus sp. LPE1-1-1.1 TaxID=3135230 RepID=UPI003426B59F